MATAINKQATPTQEQINLRWRSNGIDLPLNKGTKMHNIVLMRCIRIDAC